MFNTQFVLKEFQSRDGIKYEVPRKTFQFWGETSHLTTSQLVTKQVKDLGTQALGTFLSPFWCVCCVFLPQFRVLWCPKATILASFYVIDWTSRIEKPYESIWQTFEKSLSLWIVTVMNMYTQAQKSLCQVWWPSNIICVKLYHSWTLHNLSIYMMQWVFGSCLSWI